MHHRSLVCFRKPLLIYRSGRCTWCPLGALWVEGINAALRLDVMGAVQGAVRAFTPLCEAVTSWRQIQCEGLSNEIIQLMQLYKQNFAPVGCTLRALH